jgi:hypothetical protein
VSPAGPTRHIDLDCNIDANNGTSYELVSCGEEFKGCHVLINSEKERCFNCKSDDELMSCLTWKTQECNSKPTTPKPTVPLHFITFVENDTTIFKSKCKPEESDYCYLVKLDVSLLNKQEMTIFSGLTVTKVSTVDGAPDGSERDLYSYHGDGSSATFSLGQHHPHRILEAL